MNSHSEDETLREKLEDDKRMDDEIASRLAEEPEIEKQELGRNMGELEKEAKDMVEEMDHIEALNQTQIVRERKSYYGSQKDRKQFFNADEIASRFSEERGEKQQLGRNIGELEEEVTDVEEEMDDIEALNQTQIVRERKSYYELQKACKKFINTEKQELGRNIGELEEVKDMEEEMDDIEAPNQTHTIRERKSYYESQKTCKNFVKDMEEEMDDIEAPNQTHTIRERKSYYESQKTCKNFINADENASSLAEECETEKQELGRNIGELEEVKDMEEEMDDIEAPNQTHTIRERKSYYESQKTCKNFVKDMEEEMDDIEAPNQTHTIRERKSYYESQKTCKNFINADENASSLAEECETKKQELGRNIGELQEVKDMEEEMDDIEAPNQTHTIRERKSYYESQKTCKNFVKDMEEEMDDIEAPNQTHTIRERKSYYESQKTCKNFINADEIVSSLAEECEIEKQKLGISIGELEEVNDMGEEMDDIEVLNQTLIVRERKSYYKLQEARKESLNADEIASWLAEEPEIRKAGTGRKKGELENEVKDVEMEMDDMELEIEQIRGTIQVMKHMEEENVEVQEKMDAIMEEIKEKEGKMDDIEVLNQTLFVQEQKSNDELQETCKDLINADEMASGLAGREEQNENLHRKIIELQKELDTKQALELDIKEMRGTIQMMKHVVEENMEFKEKMDAMEELNQALIVKERESNDELQDARKELINSLKEGSTRAIIGVRRMGDLDGKPFLAAAKAKFPTEEAEGKAVELCSLWEDYLRDPRWHPFKVVVDERGNCKEVVDVEDERLKNLKDEYGEQVLNAVTLALTEMNVYNPSGRYTVPELWNFRENRRATVKEGVSHVVRQLKGNKRKRN